MQSSAESWPGDSKTLLGLAEEETIELCLRAQLSLNRELTTKMRLDRGTASE